jgi:hypothetical protein
MNETEPLASLSIATIVILTTIVRRAKANERKPSHSRRFQFSIVKFSIQRHPNPETNGHSHDHRPQEQRQMSENRASRVVFNFQFSIFNLATANQ